MGSAPRPQKQKHTESCWRDKSYQEWIDVCVFPVGKKGVPVEYVSFLIKPMCSVSYTKNLRIVIAVLVHEFESKSHLHLAYP